LATISSNLLHLSDELKFWSSKFIVRDGDQLIDVSFAAGGSSSTIHTGATQQNFLYSGTVNQFDPMIFHNTNANTNDTDFNINAVERKLDSLMKSPITKDRCKLVRNRVDQSETCNRKRTWTFSCSHGMVMRYIDDSHFGSDSVGKRNVTFQHAKCIKLKGSSVKGEIFFCVLFIV
jgi:hypothetical protein